VWLEKRERAKRVEKTKSGRDTPLRAGMIAKKAASNEAREDYMKREEGTSIIFFERKLRRIFGGSRGTRQTVATGWGKTASEASRCDRHGTCFDDGVPSVDLPRSLLALSLSRHNPYPFSAAFPFFPSFLFLSSSPFCSINPLPI
jgi:hypothetical protein